MFRFGDLVTKPKKFFVNGSPRSPNLKISLSRAPQGKGSPRPPNLKISWSRAPQGLDKEIFRFGDLGEPLTKNFLGLVTLGGPWQRNF